MTYGRATDIERGIGAPPTPEELEQLKELQVQAAVILKPLAPSIRAAAKAYPKAVRVINSAPKAERRRLEQLPIVVIARMGERRTTRPSRRGAVTRSSRSRSTQRARAPGRSTDDDPHELAAALAALIDEHGPKSACWLATQVRRRKQAVLGALHLGRFVQLGKGRSSRWDNAPVAPVAFRDAVWRARQRGELTGVEALELLISPSPRVLAMLVEVAA